MSWIRASLSLFTFGFAIAKFFHFLMPQKFIERKPHTALKLTKNGRVALNEYRKSIKTVLEDLPP
jgi:uncharacterized membrane protein YidH (DUF202 family)